MTAVTVNKLIEMKKSGEKITMLTCYDASFANLLSSSGIDILLVGDSLGMTIQGHDNTLPVTIDNMVYHTSCVKRGNVKSMIVSDLPFMSYPTLERVLCNAGKLMQAGANMIKLEGDEWLCDYIHHLNRNGIPVCAHIGLTPQSVNVTGGFKVQARNANSALKLVDTAKKLEESGASIIVAEAIPSDLGKKLSDAVFIPVIGIGAGCDTDGQVLVLHDMLGITAGGFKPKFVKNFMEENNKINEAITAYINQVKTQEFPDKTHSYS